MRGVAVSGYTDQVARELLALTAPDAYYPRIDREFVRHMLAEAWEVGYVAAAEHYDGPAAAPIGANPFRVATDQQAARLFDDSADNG